MREPNEGLGPVRGFAQPDIAPWGAEPRAREAAGPPARAMRLGSARPGDAPRSPALRAPRRPSWTQPRSRKAAPPPEGARFPSAGLRRPPGKAPRPQSAPPRRRPGRGWRPHAAAGQRASGRAAAAGRGGMMWLSCFLRRSEERAPASRLAGAAAGWLRAWCRWRDRTQPESARKARGG